MKKTFFACLTVICATLGGQAAASAACSTPSNGNSLVQSMAQGVVQARVQTRQGRLSYDTDLAQAAQRHACEMARANFFSHQGRDGSNVQVRARRAGYRDCLIAENIAWGYRDPMQVVNGWLNSPGHRRNMLEGRMREFGIGVADSDRGPYWVLVLAKPC